MKDKFNPIIIVSLILLFGVGLFGFLYKSMNDTTNNDTTVNDTTNNDQTVNDYSDLITVTSYTDTINGVDRGNLFPKLNVNLVSINSDKPGAVELNKKLKEGKYKEYYDKSYDDNGLADIIATDTYLIKNDILYITREFATYEYQIKTYYYDIKNDRILNTKELFNKLSLDLNVDYFYDSDGSGEYLSKNLTYDECDKLNGRGSCGCGLYINKDNNLEFYFKTSCK